MSTTIADAERALQALRRLSPRERLQVMMRALPELADALPDAPTSSTFWESTDIEALIAAQSVLPVTDFHALLGGWPEDEPLEPFLDALRTAREQNPACVEIE